MNGAHGTSWPTHAAASASTSGIGCNAAANPDTCGAWQCTTAPTSGRSRRISVCNGVSIVGFQRPSTTSPAGFTTTMSSSVMLA